MQKINLHFFIAAALLVSASIGNCQAPAQDGAKNSVATVNELLLLENARLLEKERAAVEKEKAGPEKEKPMGTVAPGVDFSRKSSASVDAIYGLGSLIRADITFDGQKYESLFPGSSVGQCTVKSIIDRCVALAPKSAKKTNQCPTVCWTGAAPFSPPVALMPGAAPAPLPAGFVLPAQR